MAGEDPESRWIYKLRGLSALVYPDAGVSIHEQDGRCMLSDMLDQASAELETEMLAKDRDFPKAFSVKLGPAPEQQS
jgi:hypothetical protein